MPERDLEGFHDSMAIGNRIGVCRGLPGIPPGEVAQQTCQESGDNESGRSFAAQQGIDPEFSGSLPWSAICDL